MQHATPNSIEFKYKWFDESAIVTGHKTGVGSFDGRVLKIGELVVESSELYHFNAEGNVFFLGLIDDEGGFQQVNVEVYGTDVKALEQDIHAGRTSSFANQERERLSQAGELQSYRDRVCPFCKSTILLTGLPESNQTYCEYCNTLFTADRNGPVNDERYFRICEGCGMYSRPRQFAVFYFYFLVVTFGFHHDTTIRCSGCMRWSAWKMVVGNLFGLLGFPFALIQLYRAYSSDKLIGRFAGLDDANVLARRKKIDRALEKYDLIMQNVPENAGVKYNIAFGLLIKHDFESAQTMFEMALDDCSNYRPAVNGLIRALKFQKKNKEIEAVERVWGYQGDYDVHQ